MTGAEIVTFVKGHYPTLVGVAVVLIALVSKRTGDPEWVKANPELAVLCETARAVVVDLLKLWRAWKAYFAVRGPSLVRLVQRLLP